MKRIVLILVISFSFAIAAFTDTINKIGSKKWGWALLAIVVCGILIPVIVVYLRELKEYDEKDKKK